MMMSSLPVYLKGRTLNAMMNVTNSSDSLLPVSFFRRASVSVSRWNVKRSFSVTARAER